ncbi:RNA polymerase-binding protein DksA [Psittacicella hinzii]
MTQEQVKRGRGRPRKDQTAAKAVVSPASNTVVTDVNVVATLADAPKKRGRKPKALTEALVAAAAANAAGTTAPEADASATKVVHSFKPKRGRGRPRKDETLVQEASEETTATKAASPTKATKATKATKPLSLDDDDLFVPEIEDEEDYEEDTLDDDFDEFEEETPKKGKKSSVSFDDDDVSDDNFDDNFNDLLGDDHLTRDLADVVIEKEIVPYTEREIVRIESNIDQKSYQATAKSLETLGIKPYQFEGDEDDYMNPRQLDHIKKIIMATRESLLRQLDETKEAWAEEKGQYADEVDQADHESDFAITLRNRDRERRLILKLDKTLTRIENDPDFGYCDRCGDEIGMRRLEARPTAELCINCKAKAEIHERQQKG